MKNMDKSYKVLIIMAVIVVILFFANMIINNGKKTDYTKEEYINLKNEEIPSIYKIIGEKKMIDTTEGTDNTGYYIEITYEKIEILEIADYITHFRNNNYTLISSSENSAVIANESKEKGKIITITVNFLDETTKLKYSKGNGILTRD